MTRVKEREGERDARGDATELPVSSERGEGGGKRRERRSKGEEGGEERRTQEEEGGRVVGTIGYTSD